MCDLLPAACVKLNQYTLWARCPCHPQHWNLVAGTTNLEWLRTEASTNVRRDTPDATLVILPPGETPLAPAKKKRKRKEG